MKFKTMTKEEELKILLNNIESAITIYNKAAKQLGDFTRVAYIEKDFNWLVEDLKSDGEEITADWEPDWDRDYDFLIRARVEAPEADGWFPSAFCYNS